jgi:hypothetical protein
VANRKEAGAKQAPNVRLRRDAQPYTIDGEINVGGLSAPIVLPSLEAQRRGFYLAPEELSIMLRLAGDRYKRIEPLG